MNIDGTNSLTASRISGPFVFGSTAILPGMQYAHRVKEYIDDIYRSSYIQRFRKARAVVVK